MEFHLERLPETDEELYWLVQAMWGTVIPNTPVCPDHCTPFQAFADAYFEREPDGSRGTIALWHGSRGLSGKSFMLSILGLTKAFLKGADVNLLGGSLAQSANIHMHMRNAMEFERAPRYLVTDETTQLIRLANRAKIRPLTASQKTVRGPHPPFLLLDEIDEMDIDILDASLGQPMPQKNWLGEIIDEYTVMCSTWQNPQGTFTEIKRRAEEQGIPTYTWCYRESANPVDGWLTEAAIESKKKTISKEMWRVEYELGEPSIGNRAFDSEAVEKAFSREFKPLRATEAKDYEEFVFEEPDARGQYVAGADWAKEQDYTVIVVLRIDRMPIEMAYYLRLNRRPYPAMIEKFNKAINDYSAQAIHDATGLGNVVNDYLDARAQKFIMSGAPRANMLSEYVNAVERGVYSFPQVKSAYIAHKYAQVGDLYSNSQEFHLPDEICAIALANKLVMKHVPAAAALVVPKSNVPTKHALALDMPKYLNEDAVSRPEEGLVYVKGIGADEISFLV